LFDDGSSLAEYGGAGLFIAARATEPHIITIPNSAQDIGFA
jgi:hypothetical protein